MTKKFSLNPGAAARTFCLASASRRADTSVSADLARVMPV